MPFFGNILSPNIQRKEKSHEKIKRSNVDEGRSMTVSIEEQLKYAAATVRLSAPHKEHREPSSVFCNKNYGCGCNYSIFVGYFAVTPLS